VPARIASAARSNAHLFGERERFGRQRNDHPDIQQQETGGRQLEKELGASFNLLWSEVTNRLLDLRLLERPLRDGAEGPCPQRVEVDPPHVRLGTGRVELERLERHVAKPRRFVRQRIGCRSPARAPSDGLVRRAG
jgi:hypothetical protein